MTSTTYYSQGNGQAKSTNKVIGSLFIKLVNENYTNWDEHLHIILYAYHTTFKVTTRHTLFQLVYGLYPLMPVKYLLPMNNSYVNRNFFPICILTNHMAKFQHLDETHQEAIEWTCTRQWNTMFWVQQNHKLRLSLWGTQFFRFQKVKRNTLKDSKNNGLVHEKYSIVSPIILCYLSTLTSLNQIPFW